MTKEEVLSALYRKHTTWLMMADKMLPMYRINSAEDVVQSMYVKIYEKMRNKKLLPTDIIVGDKPHYGIVYTTLHDIVVHIHRTEKPTFPLSVDIEDKKTESEAEFFEKIDNVIDGFTWFHKKLFRLYLKPKVNIDVNDENKEKYSQTEKKKLINGQEYVSVNSTIRNISEATQISYKVVFKKIKECKEEIKKKINEK